MRLVWQSKGIPFQVCDKLLMTEFEVVMSDRPMLVHSSTVPVSRKINKLLGCKGATNNTQIIQAVVHGK